LAQAITEAYYLMLSHGMVEDLLHYYSPTAQKSLTVGSAHHVCRTLEDTVTQLQSLVGMVVHIKGLLQQDTCGNGTLVVITGTCVRPHQLPFCHSLVLISTNGGGYHIQNDALCFLTVDECHVPETNGAPPI